MWGMGAGLASGLDGGCSGSQWICNRLCFLVLVGFAVGFRRLLRYAAPILTGGGGGRRPAAGTVIRYRFGSRENFHNALLIL